MGNVRCRDPEDKRIVDLSVWKLTGPEPLDLGRFISKEDSCRSGVVVKYRALVRSESSLTIGCGDPRIVGSIEVTLVEMNRSRGRLITWSNYIQMAEVLSG
jgi:hypothetical protein